MEIFRFEREDTISDLQGKLDAVDMVVHFAGVNRPLDMQDYERANVGVTASIVDYLATTCRRLPILFTSSIQAELANPYGESKLKAEHILTRYAMDSQAFVCLYRLPNVFGKWARPSYNSVVATFCHNAARGLALEVLHPDRVLELVYVDDVVEHMVRAIRTKEGMGGVSYNEVAPVYTITVADLASKIGSFAQARLTHYIPDLQDRLTRLLFTTYLSHVPVDQLVLEPVARTDKRGRLVELLKSKAAGQIFFSNTLPGVTRGDHYHDSKIEKFVVLQGNALVNIRRVETTEILSFEISASDGCKVIDIPPGYTHSITNIGQQDLLVLFWANEVYDVNEPDTHWLKV